MRALRNVYGPVLLVWLMGGCAVTPIQHTATPPAAHEITPLPRQMTGAIYQADAAVALFEDTKARRPGDIITIILVEQTDASKSAKTTTAKDNSVDVMNPTILGSPLTFRRGGGGPLSGRDLNLGAKLDSSKSFSGEGDSAQSNKLSGRLSARVLEVFPNGDLRIAGEKRITINTGDEYIRITGVVRPVDVRSDNTVLSTQVADAKIAYGGKGVIASANDMGWLGRFFNSKLWPF